jgi:hypothetical protein
MLRSFVQQHAYFLLLLACCSFCGESGALPRDDDAALMPFLRGKIFAENPNRLFSSKAKSRAPHVLVQDVPVVPTVQQADQLDEDLNQELLYKLYDDVLRSGYRKDVRPMPVCSKSSCPKRTQVRLGMRVLQILGLNADDSTLSAQVVLTLRWADPRLTFDASKYFKRGSWDSLQNSVSVNLDDLWLPDLLLANSADSHRTLLLTDTNAVLYDAEKLRHDGFNLLVIQPTLVRVKCPVDLKDFPMDHQSCRLIFRSWANAAWLKLVLTNGDAHVNISDLGGLVNTKDEYEVLGIDSKEETYQCPDTGRGYPEIVYTISLARRAEYYALNVMLPLQILSLLSMGTLYIPPGTNRIFYGVTLVLTLMSVTFFMGAYLPKSGGGNTWLENYEQNVYMCVITPLFFALFTELYCRIKRQSQSFTSTQEKELSESVERSDTWARILFGLVIGLWFLKMALDKVMMAMSGVSINILPFKVYNWILAALITVVAIIDIVHLRNRQ